MNETKLLSGKALRDRILKTSKIKETSILEHSFIFNEKNLFPTMIPAMNIALTGSLSGGLQPGILTIAGQSKHFKTLFGLVMVKAFLDKKPDGTAIFYDTEFGTPKHYFESLEIPQDQVAHTPITNIEELKKDLVPQLKRTERGEDIMIFIDSIGNIASLKELNDTENDKVVADMTRAKELKSFFRMVTPEINLKNIPMVIINHTYKEQSLYPKDIVSGGTGGIYNSNDIWIIGRQQAKETQTGPQVGWNFVINIEKSRTVREKSQILVTVKNDGGLQKYSGLWDLAIEAGIVINKGAYFEVKGFDKNVRKKDLENDIDFWNVWLNDDSFKKFIEAKYQLPKELIVYADDNAESSE